MKKELSSAKIILGSRIRTDRKARGWSQERLAEEADLSSKQIGRIENGEQFPSVPSLYCLREVLDWDQDPHYEP